MATRSITDQVQSLLSRRLAEDKVRGTLSPDIEARALYDSIALSLLIRPRNVYLLALLARNGLAKSIQDELAQIVLLRQTIVDLGNPTSTITSTKSLEAAKLALLQIESLEKIDSSSGSFSRFSNSVDSFLNKTLGTSVRVPGSGVFIRPGDEAALDLVSDFKSLVSFHNDLLERLYSIATGVANFQSSPISTILGLTTASRARLDIQDIIDTVAIDPTTTNARDYVTRLISNRATLRIIGSPPKLGDPIVSTSLELPVGYSLQGKTALLPASTTAVVPMIIPFVVATPQIGVTVGSTTIGPVNFPHTTNIKGRAYVVGSPTTPGVITIPAHYYLFVTVDGVAYKILLNGTAFSVFLTLSQVLTLLNAGLPAGTVASEFAAAGSRQIIIYSPNTFGTHSIQILTTFTDTGIGTAGGVVVYTNSAHTQLGFAAQQINPTIDTIPADVVKAAWDLLFGSITTSTLITQSSTQALLISSISTVPGVSLIITSSGNFTVNGTFTATTDTFTLFGDTPDADAVDPVSPVGLFDLGDEIVTPTGTALIEAFKGNSIQLDSQLTTFNGDITISSALDRVYPVLEANLQAFLDSWLKTNYASDLVVIDRAIAKLLGGSTLAERNAATAVLDDLTSKLNSLLTTIMDVLAILPVGSALKERKAVKAILASLEERKYDRAQDMLLKLEVQEFLALSHTASSYGGNLGQKMGDIARSDIVFPNKAKDEALDTPHTQDRTGI